MLEEAPTISRHLSNRLLNEAAAEIASSVKPLLCNKCGTLAWNASTRIRRRGRAVRGRRNRVLRRCRECATVSAYDGSYMHGRTVLAVAPSVTGAQTTGKKKPRKSHMSRRLSMGGPETPAPPTSLASSFLFEDVE